MRGLGSSLMMKRIRKTENWNKSHRRLQKKVNFLQKYTQISPPYGTNPSLHFTMSSTKSSSKKCSVPYFVTRRAQVGIRHNSLNEWTGAFIVMFGNCEVTVSGKIRNFNGESFTVCRSKYLVRNLKSKIYNLYTHEVMDLTTGW